MRHVIEHFYINEIPKLLTEIKRIMKPSSNLIMETPCMTRIIKAWSEGLMTKEHLCSIIFGFYAIENMRERSLNMMHKIIFDEELAKKILTENNFKDITFEDAPKQFNYDPKYGDYNTAFVIRCKK